MQFLIMKGSRLNNKSNLQSLIIISHHVDNNHFNHFYIEKKGASEDKTIIIWNLFTDTSDKYNYS